MDEINIVDLLEGVSCFSHFLAKILKKPKRISGIPKLARSVSFMLCRIIYSTKSMLPPKLSQLLTKNFRVVVLLRLL